MDKGGSFCCLLVKNKHDNVCKSLDSVVLYFDLGSPHIRHALFSCKSMPYIKHPGKFLMFGLKESGKKTRIRTGGSADVGHVRGNLLLHDTMISNPQSSLCILCMPETVYLT
ncbi:hypothetical protein V6N13_011806 [Hibiscus sabdariffa]